MKSAVKTVAVLLGICLVCGFLLAICNDLFFISDAVIKERALQEIYPEFVADSEPAVDPAYKSNPTYGTVEEVSKSKDGAYILKVIGVGGYKNSDIELYVAIGADAKIKGWKVVDFKGNTFTVNDGYAYIGEDISNELTFTKQSGATFTSNAATNALNMAAYYARNVLGLGENPEKDAKEAVLALLGETVELSAPLQLDKKVNATETVADKFASGSDKLSYLFMADDIQAFVYGTDENRKIVVLKNGAVDKKTENANDLATAFAGFGKLVSVSFGSYNGFTYIEKDSTSTVDNAVYTASGIRVSETPQTYVLKVTIANGAVSAINIEVNGYVPGDPSQDKTDILATGLVGATLETVDSLYTSGKVAGATHSANLITNAVKSALSQYAIDFAD